MYASVFPQFSCGCLYRLVQACTSSKSWKSARKTSYVWFSTSLVSFCVTSSHRLTTYYLHDQKFIYIPLEHGSRPWASICLLLLSSSSLTTTTTFPRLGCVQQPKQCSELTVLPDNCLDLICKSCFKLWFPHGFRILTFGKNGTLVSLSAIGKAQKGSKFFVVLLMWSPWYDYHYKEQLCRAKRRFKTFRVISEMRDPNAKAAFASTSKCLDFVGLDASTVGVESNLI